MPIEIVRYEPSWWQRLRAFIETHWQARHPVLDPSLFRWQYSGYGPGADGRPCVFLSVEGERLVGFVGAIPGLFALSGADGPRQEPGRFLAMWMVLPEYRNTGLGIHLLRKAQEGGVVTAVLGANQAVASIFRRMGFDEVPSLTRWVVPLREDYAALLPEGVAGQVHAARIRDWAGSVSEVPPACEGPFDVHFLSATWEKATASSEGLPPNGLHRTAEFYRWRYQESRGFHYHCLREEGGAAVVRVEEPARVGAPRVLRILELVPDQPGAVVTGRVRPSLVPAVLAWGRQAGCAAADFQVSGRWLAPALEAAGMRVRSASAPETCLAELLRPYRPEAAAINVFHRSGVDVRGEWCFLKSDGDMDRPNDPCTVDQEDR